MGKFRKKVEVVVPEDKPEEEQEEEVEDVPEAKSTIGLKTFNEEIESIKERLTSVEETIEKLKESTMDEETIKRVNDKVNVINAKIDDIING